MKTKKEEELVKLRKSRVKKFGCWNPTLEEFKKVVYKIMAKILNEREDGKDLVKKIVMIIKPYDETKHFIGLDWCFGRFFGKPQGNLAAIIIYKLDVMVFNLGQKDLIKEHLYYILKHELSHYFGMTHENPNGIEVSPIVNNGIYLS